MSEATPVDPPVAEVWWARTGACDWEGLSALLDDGERARLSGLRQQADKERFVLAATLVRTAVARRLGVPVTAVALDRTCRTCGAPHGKPRLASPEAPLELSITHSGGLVGVAVGERGMAVGLDVEALDRLRDLASLERAVLASTERLALERAAAAGEAQARLRAFLQLWTRKEALTKMAGLGLSLPLDRLVVSGPDEPARCLSWPGPDVAPSQVAVHDLDPPVSGHVAAVAAAHPRAVPSALDGTDFLAPP